MALGLRGHLDCQTTGSLRWARVGELILDVSEGGLLRVLWRPGNSGMLQYAVRIHCKFVVLLQLCRSEIGSSQQLASSNWGSRQWRAGRGAHRWKGQRERETETTGSMGSHSRLSHYTCTTNVSLCSWLLPSVLFILIELVTQSFELVGYDRLLVVTRLKVWIIPDHSSH